MKDVLRCAGLMDPREIFTSGIPHPLSGFELPVLRWLTALDLHAEHQYRWSDGDPPPYTGKVLSSITLLLTESVNGSLMSHKILYLIHRLLQAV